MKTSLSELKGRTIASSPGLLAGLALVALVPLIVVYFFLFQISIYASWTIPTGQEVQGILVHVFGYYGVGAYSLIAVGGAAATFRPFKFDITLFGIRFLGLMVQLFFVLDFILLVLSPYIWVSFLLIIPLVASYFVMQGAKLRIRVGVRSRDVFNPLKPNDTHIQVPHNSAVEVHVAGVSISNLRVGLEETGGKMDEQKLTKSMSEDSWEVGVVQIQNFPSTVTVLYNTSKIRRFEVTTEPVIRINSLNVDLTVLYQNVLNDGQLTMVMYDNQPLREVVKLAIKQWRNLFKGEIDWSKIKVYQESKELSLARSLSENGIVNDTKIEIAQLG